MLLLTKMVLVAVLLSGLVSLSSYTSIANATTTTTTTTTTNHVITGDTQKYRIFEGQAPTMQPSDAGMQPIQCQELLSGGTCKENSQIIQRCKLHY